METEVSKTQIIEIYGEDVGPCWVRVKQIVVMVRIRIQGIIPLSLCNVLCSAASLQGMTQSV